MKVNVDPNFDGVFQQKSFSQRDALKKDQHCKNKLSLWVDSHFCLWHSLQEFKTRWIIDQRKDGRLREKRKKEGQEEQKMKEGEE